MHARAIGTGAASRGCVGILIAALFAGGCAGEGPDAGPSDFAVRGTALGVLVPVGLELRLGDDVERLSVTEDGAFAFETRLGPGASYAVALAQPAMPCMLRDQAGTIEGADTGIELLRASRRADASGGPEPRWTSGRDGSESLPGDRVPGGQARRPPEGARVGAAGFAP